MLEIFVHALKDTAIVAVFIFIACIVIEIIEQNAMGSLKANKVLTAKAAPLLGAAVGLVPQCGFSVVATRLYTKRHIRLGTLLAVYIATSDEAVPILIANPSKVGALLPLLLIKFLFAIAVGFSMNAILSKRESKRLVPIGQKQNEISSEPNDVVDENTVLSEVGTTENKDENCSHTECGCTHDEANEHDIGCCGHHIACENSKHQKVVNYLVHPLIHTLKIVLFIFVVNFLFGTAIHFLGEDRLISFMLTDSIFQPFLAGLVGLIPNCASSVVITELYIIGGLSLGSLIAGLSVNAGIAFAILFKENKNLKENLLILFGLYLISSLLGFVICLIQNAL